jgi:hypothetical protein
MGAVLGTSLAAGAIWLGRRQQKQGAEPTRRQIMQAGLVSGLLGGVLMAAVSQACAGIELYDFGPPALPFWAPLVLGILYGPVVQWGYSVRRSSCHPLRKALISTCLGCFLLKTLATFFYILVFENGSNPSDFLLDSAMISLSGAVPFALLWVLAMAQSDPAWPPPAAGVRRLASTAL